MMSGDGPEESLEFNVNFVKYDEPVLAVSKSTPDTTNKKGKRNKEGECSIYFKSTYRTSYVDKIFDCIAPPIEWEENGKTWRKTISVKPAFRKDVLMLNTDLKSQFKYWRAKPLGLCRIRRALFTNCFSEIIRQVSVNSLDRGVILLKVRDDFRTTEEAYKRMFEDGLMYSIRKSLQAKKGTSDLKNTVISLKESINDLKLKLSNAKTKLSLVTMNGQREFMHLKKEYKKEYNFFNNNYLVLKEQLDILVPTAPPAKK